jgi:hypothetical protein
MADWLIDWLIGRLIDWLIDCVDGGEEVQDGAGGGQDCEQASGHALQQHARAESLQVHNWILNSLTALSKGMFMGLCSSYLISSHSYRKKETYLSTLAIDLSIC